MFDNQVAPLDLKSSPVRVRYAIVRTQSRIEVYWNDVGGRGRRVEAKDYCWTDIIHRYKW